MTGFSHKYHENRTFWSKQGKGIVRLLTLILCLSLFCTFLPMTAYDEEAEEKAIEGTEYIAQEEIDAPNGSAVTVENVVIEDCN